MRQMVWIILGLVLLAVGAQGVIRLVIDHEPGALRWLPGGFLVQLAVYGVLAVSGLRMARRNRVHPDPDRHRH